MVHQAIQSISVETCMEFQITPFYSSSPCTWRAYVDKKERGIDSKANATLLEIRLCKGCKKTSTSSILGLFYKGVG